MRTLTPMQRDRSAGAVQCLDGEEGWSYGVPRGSSAGLHSWPALQALPNGHEHPPDDTFTCLQGLQRMASEASAAEQNWRPYGHSYALDVPVTVTLPAVPDSKALKNFANALFDTEEEPPRWSDTGSALPVRVDLPQLEGHHWHQAGATLSVQSAQSDAVENRVQRIARAALERRRCTVQLRTLAVLRAHVAATRLQAAVRGHRARRESALRWRLAAAAITIQHSWRRAVAKRKAAEAMAAQHMDVMLDEQSRRSSGSAPLCLGVTHYGPGAPLFLGACFGAVPLSQEVGLFRAVLESDEAEVSRVLAVRPHLVKECSTERGTALHLAVTQQSDSIARRLLVGGAEVNAQTKQGLTPLHCAAMVGSLSLTQLLFKHGADASPTTDGELTEALTPLHGAARHGSAQVLQLLLSQGADVRETSTSGWTALHVACNAGHRDAADLLLRRGAAVDAKDAEGRTALNLACKLGNGELVRMLIAHGASLATHHQVRQAGSA